MNLSTPVRDQLTKVGIYLAAGLVSAALIRWLQRRHQRSIVSPFNPPVESYKPVTDITV